MLNSASAMCIQLIALLPVSIYSSVVVLKTLPALSQSNSHPSRLGLLEGGKREQSLMPSWDCGKIRTHTTIASERDPFVMFDIVRCWLVHGNRVVGHPVIAVANGKFSIFLASDPRASCTVAGSPAVAFVARFRHYYLLEFEGLPDDWTS